jgi:hypothetical protein
MLSDFSIGRETISGIKQINDVAGYRRRFNIEPNVQMCDARMPGREQMMTHKK